MGFKQLFCKHQYKEINRYYTYEFLMSLIGINYYNLIAYKEYKCVLCNKNKIDKVYDGNYRTKDNLVNKIREMKNMKYIDYETYRLE